VNPRTPRPDKCGTRDRGSDSDAGNHDDHGDIGQAPVFEVVGLEQIFETAIGFAYVLAASRRLDLNAKQLAERRTAIGIAQLDDPVRAGFEPAARVVDELHFEDELLDSGLAKLAQDLAVSDSLGHRPILRVFRSPARTHGNCR
jgi:hypothetical protein